MSVDIEIADLDAQGAFTLSDIQYEAERMARDQGVEFPELVGAVRSGDRWILTFTDGADHDSTRK